MRGSKMERFIYQWSKSLEAENDFNKRYTRSTMKFASSPRFALWDRKQPQSK